MGKRGPKPKFDDISCPNPECRLFGERQEGNIISKGTRTVSSGDVVRVFQCTTCGKRFTDRSGTAYNRTRYPKETVREAILWARLGVPLASIARDAGISRSTLYRWIRFNQMEAVMEEEQYLDRMITVRRSDGWNFYDSNDEDED